MQTMYLSVKGFQYHSDSSLRHPQLNTLLNGLEQLAFVVVTMDPPISFPLPLSRNFGHSRPRINLKLATAWHSAARTASHEVFCIQNIQNRCLLNKTVLISESTVMACPNRLCWKAGFPGLQCH